jgi:hypothetical protein
LVKLKHEPSKKKRYRPDGRNSSSDHRPILDAQRWDEIRLIYDGLVYQVARGRVRGNPGVDLAQRNVAIRSHDQRARYTYRITARAATTANTPTPMLTQATVPSLNADKTDDTST